MNPLGGCLPLLIQMPIFIAFYQSLLNFNFVNPEHAGFLWIPNIGEPDPYLILAILSALTTFLQQKLSMVSSNNDKTQRIMLYFMPLMMAWIAVKMPAGLPLYWVLFNIFGILQQLYVNRTQNTLSSGDMDGNNYAAESNKGGPIDACIIGIVDEVDNSREVCADFRTYSIPLRFRLSGYS